MLENPEAFAALAAPTAAATTGGAAAEAPKEEAKEEEKEESDDDMVRFSYPHSLSLVPILTPSSRASVSSTKRSLLPSSYVIALVSVVLHSISPPPHCVVSSMSPLPRISKTLKHRITPV